MTKLKQSMLLNEKGRTMFAKIPNHVQPYVMRESESAYKAFAKISINVIYKIILIVDENEKLIGVISESDTKGKSPLVRALSEEIDATVADVCTKNYSFLTTEQDKYLYGTRQFVEKRLNELPIVNKEGVPIEIFGRFQAFFQQYVSSNSHIRTHYAKAIGAAGELASIKGYDRISIIEFGVAAGEGLRLAEIYAMEVSQLFGINIDVYGFDSGIGLLTLHDYRDVHNHFAKGLFQTDVLKLKASLRNAHLVIGDICDTAKEFLSSDIAPIGAMLIDVDVYRPAVAILDMLLEDDKYFLPEVYLYFDDLANNWEFQGEALAIKEFNAKSVNAKIAPELSYCSLYWMQRKSIYAHNNIDATNYMNEWGLRRLKVCMRFSHPRFIRERPPSKSIFIG